MVAISTVLAVMVRDGHRPMCSYIQMHPRISISGSICPLVHPMVHPSVRPSVNQSICRSRFCEKQKSIFTLMLIFLYFYVKFDCILFKEKRTIQFYTYSYTRNLILFSKMEIFF